MVSLSLSPASASKTLIPLAVFPTYNQEEDETGSMDFIDPDAEIDEDEDDEESEDDEEDYDSNPLYIVLSTSLSPRLKDAYDSAKLVLLPTRRALPLDMPRKLPDPTIEFESEWEQWIAAHTFVAADTLPGPSRTTEPAKGNVDWVALSKAKDRQVNLCLKPGTGIAEVRMTMAIYNSSSSSNSSTLPHPRHKPASTQNITDTLPDFSTPHRPSSELDPHRTIRAKPIDLKHRLQDQSVSNRFSKSSTVTSELTATTSCSSSSVPCSDIIRSPSTTTESSSAFTRASSGVSRTSSEAWSDMPTTPPSTSRISDAAQPCSTADSVTKVQYAKIISEETMYRSPPRRPTTPAITLESALSGSKAKKGKEVEQRLRFKAPKWLRPGAAQKEKERERERREKALAVAHERERERLRLLEGEGGGGLERVRLISLKGPVIECWWQAPVDSLESAGEQCADEHENSAVVPFPCHQGVPTLASPVSASGMSRSSVSLSCRSTYSSSLRMTRRSSSVNTKDTSDTSRKDVRRRSRRMPSGLSVLRHGSSSTRSRSLMRWVGEKTRGVRVADRH